MKKNDILTSIFYGISMILLIISFFNEKPVSIILSGVAIVFILVGLIVRYRSNKKK